MHAIFFVSRVSLDVYAPFVPLKAVEGRLASASVGYVINPVGLCIIITTGSFGTVTVAVHKTTAEVVAVKRIPRQASPKGFSPMRFLT